MKYFKLLKLFLFFVIVICHLYSQEGWVLQNSGTNYSLVSIIFLNNNTGYCSGIQLTGPPIQFHGCVIKTTNGGENWLSVYSIDGSTVNGISCPSIDTVYAILGNNIIKTTNGGGSWSVYTLGPVSSIAFINNNTGFAVGDGNGGGGVIYKTTNGGTNWSINIITASGSVYRDVHFIDYNTGYVACNNFIFKTTNSGQNWQQ